MRILLLAPASMPQATAWRRTLKDEFGTCDLASIHLGAGGAGDDVIDLAGGRRGVLAALLAIPKLRRLAKEKRPDIVLAYYLSSYGVLAALCFKGRFICVPAGSDIFPSRLRWLRNALARFAIRRSAGSTAWTEAMRERLVHLGCPPGRIVVGPRGIDLREFAPRPRSGAAPKHLRVITTRRLRPIFRHDVLLSSLAILRARDLPVRLKFVGTGDDEARLRQVADALRIADVVEFCGALAPEALSSQLGESDVFISLSRSDGLSTSLVEAIAMGVVPIVSDIPANTTVVESGVNGLVVRGDDPAEIADAIQRLASDPAFLESARRRCIELARSRFDVRVNTRHMIGQVVLWNSQART